ncbi:stage III sporulation protein AE [Huintestinicola sp.]|uniref:stage III sporulation protein AE n=1 Tax=Huintestinicola sp. TaxID=2981661 RepID=UPI003D7CFBD8
MKKLILAIITAALAVLLCSFSVSAEEISLGELAEEYGINEISEALPYDAESFLRDKGISPDDPDSITKLTPKTVISYMWEKLKYSAAAPVRLFGIVLSVIILGAASGAAADSIGNKGSTGLYRTITVMTAIILTVPSMESCIKNAAATLKSGSEFMLCYVPVFAGISAAAGNAASSLSYNAIVLLIAEAAVKIASDMLMPVISVCMAMNIIDAVNPTFSLSSVTGLMKKMTTLLLGFGMTVFTGLLSIQSIVGASADTLGVKAAKFVVSNFVPVVGSAVADAYSTMRSGLGLLRGAAGAFGIIALCVTLLPPVLETLCLYLAMTAGEAAAEMFGVKELGTFFKGAASVMSLTAAILACFGVMFVISTVILMAAGLGTVNA